MPVLSTGQIKIIDSTGQQLNVRVLFDSGAEINLISERCLKQLKLIREQRTVHIHGITGGLLSNGVVNVQLAPWFDDNNEFCLCRTFVIVKEIPVSRRSNFNNEIPEFNKLQRADPNYNRAGKIDMLMGVRIWAEIIEQTVIPSKSGLVAQKTKFGYAIFGTIEPTHRVELNIISVNFAFQGEDSVQENINETLKRFWEMTDVTEQESPLTIGELRAEEIYEKTTRRGPKGEYIVRIPFIDGDKELGESRGNSLERFYELERRLRRINLRERYNKFMMEYLELGHMRYATLSEKGAGGYYIPQHVVKEKFRVVFDGSSASTNGKSVNNIQLAGPNLQDKLFHVAMRFRMNKFALTTDVKKMFRQIKVDEQDQLYQKIFFRPNESVPVEEFVLTTVTYGLRASPYLSGRTMLQLAKDYSEKYPLAAEAIRTQRYVDDILTGADTEEEVVELYNQLINIMKEANMELSKWRANSQGIMKRINQDFDRQS